MIIDRLCEKRNFITVYILFSVVVVVNILTIASPLTLTITIPQYLLVLYTLVKGEIRKSVLLHFSFVMLSLSAQGTLGMFDKAFSLYNYGTIKLFGPVRACYLLNIIYCFLLAGSRYTMNYSTLLYKFFKIALCLCGVAFVVGICGLLVNPFYSFDSFIDYGIYAFALITSLYILLKVENHSFIKSAYYLTLACIMAGIAGSFLCYITGSVVSHYSVYDIAYTADVTIIALTLVVGIPYIHERMLLWLSLALYGALLSVSLGGKNVFGIAFSLSALAYLLFFDKGTINNLKKNDRFLRPTVVIVVVAVALYVMRHLASDSMASYKLASAASMFSGDLDSMSRSPYIRVASLINIIDNGLSNPLALLFGHGYGGYFQDSLGLFEGIDLSNGAWKDEVIKTGRFTSGHDAMVTIPLFNGLIGAFLFIKICWLYIKRMGYNYMNSIAFFCFFLMFYFNTIYAMIGVFGLVGAEYNINGHKTDSN